MTDHDLRVGVHLLDRQLIDADGRLAGKVDDVELAVGGDGTALVAALVSGPGVLATRLGRRSYGPWRERLESEVEPASSRITHIPIADVRRIDSGIDIALRREQLASTGTERWVRTHVIDHVPGSRSGGEDDGAGHPEDADRPAGTRSEHRPTAGAVVRVGQLLGRPVVDEHGGSHGVVLDLMGVQDRRPGAPHDAAILVVGLVVGRHRGVERLGLFQPSVHGPWLLLAFERRAARHRRSIRWDQLVDPVADSAEPGLPLRFGGRTEVAPEGR